jgi:flavin-dependent dehydrogenase
VGDAAGQTKATTGGGVIFGCRCAKIAADRTASFIHDAIPLEYDEGWRNKYGRTLNAHRAIRTFYNTLNSTSVSALVQLSSWMGAGLFASHYGDMDDLVS